MMENSHKLVYIEWCDAISREEPWVPADKL